MSFHISQTRETHRLFWDCGFKSRLRWQTSVSTVKQMSVRLWSLGKSCLNVSSTIRYSHVAATVLHFSFIYVRSMDIPYSEHFCTLSRACFHLNNKGDYIKEKSLYQIQNITPTSPRIRSFCKTCLGKVVIRFY